MYVITHHHDYDEVLLGPVNWNSKFFSSVIQSDLDLDYRPEIKDSDKYKVPFDILPNVRIREVTVIQPEYNPKTQFLNGPYWTYTENDATASYNVEYKNLDLVKSELKQEIAGIRYDKEISGTKITLNNKEISLTTNRSDRDLYVQKYIVMGDSDTVDWKFPEGWMTLTKSEMSDIVNAVNNHVQDAFLWELTKSTEIDNAITHEEALEIMPKPPMQNIEDYNNA